MGKYFCPVCTKLTFALRYMKNTKWIVPKPRQQYCEKCRVSRPLKSCFKGVKGLEKRGRR